SVATTMAKFTGDALSTALPELSAEPDTERLIGKIDGETSAVVVQYPDILGRITDLTPSAEIVVGEGQSIGVGLQFGGPYVGLFACREKHVRQMRGRLAGETVDAEGKR